MSRDGKIGARSIGQGRGARGEAGCALWPASTRRSFAGHSLRAGLATTAAKAGKSERAIMRQTGHRSVAMVSRYIRDADLFSDNAAAGLL